MGNASAHKLIEVTLSIPGLSASQSSQLIAEVHVGSGGGDSDTTDTLHPGWGEAFSLEVSEGSDVRISIVCLLDGCKSELCRVRLPSNLSCLEPGTSKLMQFAVGTTSLVVELRAVDPSNASTKGPKDPKASDFQFHLPSARRQAISLELQNAELQKLARARHGNCRAAPAAPMKHRHLLERAQVPVLVHVAGSGCTFGRVLSQFETGRSTHRVFLVFLVLYLRSM